MADQTSTWKIIADRIHTILNTRHDQLQINLLGLRGGRPYVDNRLSRFAGETEVDWSGGTRKDGTTVTGRRDQAHLIPYLARIAEKINQHVLGVSPQRKGARDEVVNDITNMDESINDFMRELNDYITACRWAWIGIDAPVVDSVGPISREQKDTAKIRPYWTLYSPLQVVDWNFNQNGTLTWILTEIGEYQGSDPFSKPKTIKLRKLWEPGQVTVFTFDQKDQTRIESEATMPVSYTAGVPFVPVGTISAKPYRFDDLESISRTIMDLESCNRQNFFNCVFPQEYIPVSALEAVKENFSVGAEEAVSMIMGYNYPILLGEGDKEPGYIMPNASAIGTMRQELKDLRKELYDTVGLMLQQETRQVASAEAKAWDFLDIQQVMRQRAEILEAAETKAIEISHAWDSDFPVWEPKYNREFDVSDFAEEMKALVQTANMQMPSELMRFILKRIYEAVKRLGVAKVEEKENEIILEAIEAFGEMEPLEGAGITGEEEE